MPVKWFRHLWHHHTSAIEFAHMMLEYRRFTGSDIREYLPVVEGMVVWYDQYYRKLNKQRSGSELDKNGSLVLYPTSALEYAGGTRNPTNVIAGLRALTDGLLALPDEYLSAEKRAYYAAVRKRLPPVPLKEVDGKQTIAVAISEDFGGNRMEFPQMYAVFPFDVYGLGRRGLALARDTWAAGKPGQKFSRCWGYAGIMAARLGLTREAKRHCLESLLSRHKSQPARFPAHYRVPADQTPDHDHGGSAMIGLQEMLMQTYGREIRLLPAWPKDWDVDFRLHAPYQTVVEGKVRGGKIASLTVTPESRADDVVMPPPQ